MKNWHYKLSVRFLVLYFLFFALIGGGMSIASHNPQDFYNGIGFGVLPIAICLIFGKGENDENHVNKRQ